MEVSNNYIPESLTLEPDGVHVQRLERDDLGIGRVAAQASTRFLRSDGSFNSRRVGLGAFSSLNPFYWALKLSWFHFFSLVALAFVGLNIVFAFAYFACGTGALVATVDSPALQDRFWLGFFFSVETLSTIGYGHIVPFSLVAHVLSTVQAFVGLIGVAVATGLVFARFSRPTARILLSKNALIAPYQDGFAVMFRIVNGLKNEVIELDAQVTLARFEWMNGERVRQFHKLVLERDHVPLFPLAWTLVHPVNQASPLFGVTEADFLASEAELLVVLHGMDDVLFQRVHARGSYKADEFVWRAKFVDMYVTDFPGVVAVDVSRLSVFDRLV